MASLLIFDLETTGVNPQLHKPVQVSVVHQPQLVEQQYILMNALCNPGEPIPEGAANVHGITDARVAYMPSYTTVLWQLQHIVGAYAVQDDECFLAGHNISEYDVPLWRHCMKGTPLQLPLVIDSLDLLNRLYPDMRSKKLGDAYEAFFGERPTDLHDAITDCLVTGKIIDFISRDKNMPYLEMADWLAEPEPYEVMPFGKHAGKSVSEVPVGYFKWCMENFDRIRPDLQATIEEALDNEPMGA